jgi:hypothetical protein
MKHDDGHKPLKTVKSIIGRGGRKLTVGDKLFIYFLSDDATALPTVDGREVKAIREDGEVAFARNGRGTSGPWAWSNNNVVTDDPNGKYTMYFYDELPGQFAKVTIKRRANMRRMIAETRERIERAQDHILKLEAELWADTDGAALEAQEIVAATA